MMSSSDPTSESDAPPALVTTRTLVAIGGVEFAVTIGLIAWEPAPSLARWLLVACVSMIVMLSGFLVPLGVLGTVPLRRASILLAPLSVGGLLMLTGGLSGALIPLLVRPPLVQVVRSSRRQAIQSLAVVCATVIALLLLPSGWMGPIPSEPAILVGRALLTMSVLLTLGFEVLALREAHQSLHARVQHLRDNILSEHEQRARGMEAIGARVAHELKNPLTSIKSLLSLQREEEQDPAAAERLDVVSSEVDRMRTIIGDYLSFSRPLDRLRLSAVDPNRLVFDVVDVLSARAQSAGIDLIVSGTARPILADGGRLRAALMNFIINAIEATPGGGTVGVELRSAGTELCISVRDTGRGLTAEALAQLGTPYFTTKAQGTGLGVVIAKSTIEQHGGSIRYESTSGGGTTLQVRLPHDRRAADSAMDSYESLANLDSEALSALRAEHRTSKNS